MNTMDTRITDETAMDEVALAAATAAAPAVCHAVISAGIRR